MVDETGAEQAAAETVTAPNEQAVDIEARAFRMGWRPKDQYKGPEAEWIPAEQFVERVMENVPVLKRTIKTMDERFARQEKEFGELKQTFSDYREFATRAEQRAYEKAKKDLMAQRDVAIQHADVDTVRQVETQIAELDKTAKPPATETTRAETINRPDPAILEWVGENPWFSSDRMLHGVAQSIDGALIADRPGLSVRERLSLVKEEVQRRFPEKFSNPRRETPSAVAATNAPSQRRKSGHAYEDLPPEAKKACDKIVAQFKGHKKPFTRDEYVASYDWGDQ